MSINNYYVKKIFFFVIEKSRFIDDLTNIDSKLNELKGEGKREREMSREWIVKVEIGTTALKDVKSELIRSTRINSRAKKINYSERSNEFFFYMRITLLSFSSSIELCTFLLIYFSNLSTLLIVKISNISK